MHNSGSLFDSRERLVLDDLVFYSLGYTVAGFGDS